MNDDTSLALSAELGRQPIESAPQRNPFIASSQANVIDSIDGTDVEHLVSEYGSPLFVFSEQAISNKCREMRDAFERRYRDVEYAWSYKTNHLLDICRAFRARGWIADVASAVEFQKALQVGHCGQEVVVNGPAKDRALVEMSLREGAVLQIDNWDELRLVEEVCLDMTQPVDIGLRICLDAGIRPIWTKFGFILSSGEALEAAKRVIANGRLRLHTLHTHIGTYVLAPQAYGVATRKLLALRDAIFLETGQLVPCLNLGGGFPSDSLLHGMTGPAERVVPRIGAYAESICAPLASLPKAKQPKLRLEAGRHLIDNAGYLVATVCARKGVRFDAAQDEPLAGYAYKERLLTGFGPKVGYVIDAGINLLYTAAWFRIEASPTRRSGGEVEASILYGPLCMSIDVIRESVPLPRLDAGARLVLHPVGAYNFNHAMQFIYERPAVVMIAESGPPRLIRRRETVADSIGPETTACIND